MSEVGLAIRTGELIRKEMRDALQVDIDDLEWEEYRTIWEGLNDAEDSILWARALVCVAIDSQYGEEDIKAFAADVGIGESTAYRYRRTWLAFPVGENRFPELSFSHHAIAAMTNDPNYWVEEAALHGLSTHALEKKVRQAQQRTKAALVEETKKALAAGEEPPGAEDVSIPSNHNVPLSPTRPGTYTAEEEKADREELEKLASQWFFDRVEEGFLVSQIVKAMRDVLESVTRR